MILLSNQGDLFFQISYKKHFMPQQNYSNHVRYYTPHHFIFYPLILVAFTISLWFTVTMREQCALWAAVTFIFFLLGWLSFMFRQHYALTLQNRVVRLELRLRYYQLTQQRLEEFESKLSLNQLAALRFASDEELPLLLEKAFKENLPPKEIKKLIKNWLPDHNRV
jgi:hypothetical protein